MTDTHDRRTMLKYLGVAAAGTALAGCSSSSSTNTNGNGDDTGGDSSPDDGGDSGSGATKTDTVSMTDDLAFDPKAIQVEAGTTVTWETTGSVGHTVTAYEDKLPEGAAYFASGGFESEDAAIDGYPDEGNVKEGETFEHTFETKGTYEYYCIPHEMNGMVGTVEVI
jgi:plastocyanin